MQRVVIIGAGVGGLAAAADLARRGADVLVLERASQPGGKMRQVMVGGAGIDAGPTVFTMRWVFEGLFNDAGRNIEDFLTLRPADVLARHAWRQGGQLDLYADIDKSAAAIGDFAGAADARGYRDFVARATDVYRTLREPFMASPRPSPFGLVARVGIGHLGAMWRTAPLQNFWSALGQHFNDPRLRQLFGRYATYVGSSPFLAPATLMLIAHVEQDGVWLVQGGMRRVADALCALGALQGARYRFDADVSDIVVRDGRAAGVVLEHGERIEADAVVFNGDAQALAWGKLGHGVFGAVPRTDSRVRSLSAITWCLRARADGFKPHHHNVFFAEDYASEFNAIFRNRRITQWPTVYMCAQDRCDDTPVPPGTAERLLLLINAPADGDVAKFNADTYAPRVFELLRNCGLRLTPTADMQVATTPDGFERLFPASGGALYGRANHGAMASFRRPGASTRVPGLYLAGGSVHPGAGIPMAAMSGRLAADAVLRDFAKCGVAVPAGAPGTS
jgi:1-hydroxycarotenoid 3,4-desaturase